MIEEAVKKIYEVAAAKHKQQITTTAAFITLMTEQLGQVARTYWHIGKKAHTLPTDITDVIVQAICLLNWLGCTETEIEEALEASIDKLEVALHR